MINPLRALFGVEPRFDVIAAQPVSQTPGRVFLEALGGGPSSSGITITPGTAETLPAVWSCINVLACDLAQLPIKVYRRAADGSKAEDPTHPLYAILHELANPETTAFEFVETMQRHLLAWGNAYAEIQRDDRGRVIALWPLAPWRMQIDRDGLNRLRYRYTNEVGQRFEWLFDWRNPPILHIRMNSLDGVMGRSPVHVLRDAFGLTKAAESYGASLFRNGARPSIVLEAPKVLKDGTRERLRTEWAQLHGGVENANKPAVLQEGMTAKPISIPPEDAQFLETRKFQDVQICGIYRVPPHKIGILDRATFSNIEHQSIEYVTGSLMPHGVRWQQAMARDLLNSRTFTTHVALFVMEALLRGDTKTRFDAYKVAKDGGWMSTNDIRRREDDPLVAAESGGDVYWMPANMQHASNVPPAPRPAPMLPAAG